MREQKLLVQLLQRVLTEREELIAFCVAQSLYRRLEGVPEESNWQGIESLSQLRATVGGRFQKLKERWLEAGFPLRAAKGERESRGTLQPDGWTRLEQWLLKHGFEVRLGDGVIPEVLFEVRPAARNSDTSHRKSE